MPASTQRQARYFRWLEHDKPAAKASGMSHQQLHDFASTPDAGLPEHADPGMSPMASRHKRWIGHGNNDTSVFPGGHTMDGITHGFAKTSDGPAERMDSGGTGNWMERAVKRPGALTKKANSAGQSPMAFAHKNYHASGRTGQQARFAVNAQK